MHFELNEEQKLWYETVHDFCQNELKPRAQKTDEQGELPMDVVKKMADVGFLSMAVPEELGGPGLDGICVAIAIEEIGRACGSTALSIAAHNGLGVGPIVNFGSQAQQEKYLPRLTSGDYLGALGLTEPNSGSDLLNSLQTSAVRDGDEWVVNGSKAWITNVRYSPMVTTLCRTDPQAGSRGFNMIVVDTETPGFTINPPEKKMGLRGSPTHMLSYDNVRVPAGQLLGQEGRGFQQTMQTLDSGRITIGAMAVGMAQAALDEAIQYAHDRQSFGKSIGKHQAIQHMLADMGTEIEAARLMVYKSAWLKQEGKDFTTQASMGKLFASEVAERAAFKAIQIHGGYGYSAEFPVERIYRDQRLLSIGEGTSEILRMVIGRRVLG